MNLKNKKIDSNESILELKPIIKLKVLLFNLIYQFLKIEHFHLQQYQIFL